MFLHNLLNILVQTANKMGLQKKSPLNFALSHKYVPFKLHVYFLERPPLYSSGQSSWLQIQSSRVRFPALPDFSESSYIMKSFVICTLRQV
jgi:hypothetical protein